MGEQDTQTQQPEEINQTELTAEGSKLTSPLGLIMFFIAAILDAAGLIVVLIASDDAGILDIIGLFFLGPLIFISSGSNLTKKLKRIGITFLIENIPFIGGLCPSWLFAVYRSLKE